MKLKEIGKWLGRRKEKILYEKPCIEHFYNLDRVFYSTPNTKKIKDYRDKETFIFLNLHSAKGEVK